MGRSVYLIIKRLMDVTAAGIGIVLLSPLLAGIAILVKCENRRGPVFYRGVRTGKNGQPFHMLKFRTMVPDAELKGGTATAHRDPRITRVGHWLRHYKLDELPQLINVLKGEMSLVGPRPEVAEHTSVYSEEERVILTVTPGITDLSSLRFINLNQLLGSEDPGRVFVEKYRDEKNRLRVQYVREQSFWMDIKILFLTVFRIFVRE